MVLRVAWVGFVTTDAASWQKGRVDYHVPPAGGRERRYDGVPICDVQLQGRRPK